MRSPADIDDLQGDATLRAFADDVRAYAWGPAPTVRADLASVLAGGIGGGAPAHAPAPARPGPLQGASGRWRDRLQARRGRVALGLSVLSLTVLGTGGAGALPGPAQAVFERTAEVVGIELPAATGRAETPGPSDPAREAPPGAEIPDESQTPAGPTGPADGRPAPPPLDDERPDPPPVEPGSPAPLTPSPGDGRPGEPRGEAPGGEVGREAGDRVPERLPGPDAPPRPGPPASLPQAPPAEGTGESSGDEDDGSDRVDRDVNVGVRGDEESRPGTGEPAALPVPGGRPAAVAVS